MQETIGEIQTEARNQSCSGHDHTHHHEVRLRLNISFHKFLSCVDLFRYLPREVDPLVYNMSHEDPGDVSYSNIGGLGEQIRELREVIELPLLNPELFQRVGIVPPKGCLLYGPPGTGKTLLARAVASQLDANFLKVVSSAIVDKYIGRDIIFFKFQILNIL